MAATLAERRQESGHRQAGRSTPSNVPGVLAVMATAGLYDDSGKWLYHTGLPGEERRRRRPDRRLARQVRHRRHLAAARQGRQQRARAARDRRHLECARRQSVRAARRKPDRRRDAHRAITLSDPARGSSRKRAGDDPAAGAADLHGAACNMRIEVRASGSCCPADTSAGVVLVEIDRRCAVPARQDVGLRQHEHLGVGRLRGRVHRRPGGGSGGRRAHPRRDTCRTSASS